VKKLIFAGTIAAVASACSSVDHSICDQLGTHMDMPVSGRMVIVDTSNGEPSIISIQKTGEEPGRYMVTDDDNMALNMNYCSSGDTAIVEVGEPGEFYVMISEYLADSQSYNLELLNWESDKLEQSGIPFEDSESLFGIGETITVRNAETAPEKLIDSSERLPFGKLSPIAESR
jgi:hypothetical protein